MRKAALITMFAVVACKPPPTDADIVRDMPEAEPTFASDPLPSPDTEGAVWALSPNADNRIIYGTPGEAALLALECLDSDTVLPKIEITRFAAADKGAGALLALVGNGHIGRFEVDATEVGGRTIWRGAAPAAQVQWEPLSGPRQVTVTIPGAGMVTLNPNTLAGRFLEACRAGDSIDLTEADEAETDPSKPADEPKLDAKEPGSAPAL